MAINPRLYSTDTQGPQENSVSDPRNASLNASVGKLAAGVANPLTQFPEWYIKKLFHALPASEQANILKINAANPGNPLPAAAATVGIARDLGLLTKPISSTIGAPFAATGEAADVWGKMAAGLPLDAGVEEAPPQPNKVYGTTKTPEFPFEGGEQQWRRASARFMAQNAARPEGLVLPTGAAESAPTEMAPPPTDQTPGTISAYDRGTGRYWQNYSRNNPTPTNIGTYDPIGGAQGSETAAMPFNMGGRYTKVNQGGSNMGELRNPDMASAYVKGNLERHKAEDMAPAVDTADTALKLKTAQDLIQYTPAQRAVIQGVATHGPQRASYPPETEAAKLQARLAALAYLREKQAQASYESRAADLASKGVQIPPEKQAELLDEERRKIARKPDAELSAVGSRFDLNPDSSVAYINQATEQP